MMKVPHTTFSTCCKDTDNLVVEFAKIISPNTIIYLNGDVGTGKTYFAKKFAKQFGVCDLSSSSFERISIHKKQINFIHCDLYRDENSSSFEYELDYHLIDPWILVVEWPKKNLSIRNCNHYVVNIAMTSINNRSIYIESLTDSDFIV